MQFAEAKAREIAGLMHDADTTPGDVKVVAFDPMTILMILSVLINAIRMFQACGKTPTIAQKTIVNDSSITRLQLRKLVRKEASELPWADRSEFRKHCERAIRKMGETIKVEDIEKLFEDAKNGPEKITQNMLMMV